MPRLYPLIISIIFVMTQFLSSDNKSSLHCDPVVEI